MLLQKLAPPERPHLLALAAGGLLPLAFAPFEHYWIAPFLLALLFRIWQQAGSVRQAALYGWLFGVGLFGVGASWVQVSTMQFGGVNLPLSLLITALFVAGMALFPALQGGLLLWLRGRFQWFSWALFPLLWVVVEWLRGWLFGGFPWLLLGHTAPGSLYRGLAPWLGTLGVSLFVATLALLLLRAVVEPQQRRRSVLQLLLLLGIAWGSGQQQWGEPMGAPIPVALVQGNIAQEQKWRPQNLHRTLSAYRAATEQSRARLVVWPETAIPAFRQQVETVFLQPLAQRLAAEGRTLLSGVPLLESQGGRRYYYNSMVMVGADHGSYHKRHLVPMGEYLPLEWLLRPLLGFIQIPFSSFSHGRADQPPLQLDALLLAPTICYEIAYSDLAFSHLPQAGVLVTISNDAWFGDSLAPAQHLQIARMRALESARPLLRATNTGITVLIGADGEIAGELPRSEAAMLEVVVQPRQGVTPYLRWAALL
jgi:apolipoprotein N-acyltransferase